MLELGSAGKAFNSRTIFSDLSLTLSPGEFKVLVGPSGCGKSTLFDCLTGVIPLDSGTIVWKGQPLAHLGHHAAYMQQKDLLLPWFTLMENSLLPMRTGNRKIDGDARAKAEALFDRLGLNGCESLFPRQVSGGMRQRCALVRTLMFDREFILLDEPLSALDAITRQGLQSLLRLLQSEFGKTILMITHDIEEALTLGDEICLLTRQPMKIYDVFRPRAPKPRSFDHPEVIQIKGEVLALLEGDLHGAA